MSATHLLVANPTAQSGKNAERIDRARAEFARRGVTVDFLATLPEGKTAHLVADTLNRSRSYNYVVYMGGDGTFREVAHGLLASPRSKEVALGMLPTGTANDQGKSFGLSSSPEALDENIDVIIRGRETRLDAGWITVDKGDGRSVVTMFFDSAGWGISARILAARNEDRKLVEGTPLGTFYRDQLVYAGAALRVFLDSYVTPDKFDAEIDFGGGVQVLRGLTDLVVKNTRIYGGEWVFDRTSKHDDGYFEIVPFQGRLDWMSRAIIDLNGNPMSDETLGLIEHTQTIRARQVTLRFSIPDGTTPLAAQIDGEEFHTGSTVHIRVEPKALRLIVP